MSGSGFELFQPFDVRTYNQALNASQRQAYGLPTILPTASTATSNSTAPDSALGVVVGNTVSLWSHFCAHLRASPNYLEVHAMNPFDDWVTATVTQACTEVLGPSAFSSAASAATKLTAASAAAAPASSAGGVNVPYDLRWVWEMAAGRRVAFQRLTDASGLAPFEPSAHLNVHPHFGPWIALRSVLLFDARHVTLQPPASSSASATSPATAFASSAAAPLLDAAWYYELPASSNSASVSPCVAAGCVEAQQKALQVALSEPGNLGCFVVSRVFVCCAAVLISAGDA
jgi:hypothetical protein